jgi:signal transduction histidine kinase
VSDPARGPAPSPPFLDWARSLDARWLRATYWPAGWIAAAVALALVLTGVATVPPAREYFALRLAPALALEALALAVALACFEVDVRRGLSSRSRGLYVLATGVAYQLHGSGLVALSEPPGAFVLAVLPILGAWGQCAATRATPRHPYVALAQGAGLAAVLALRPEPGTAAILAVVALIGLGGGLLLGTFLERVSLHLADLDTQRAAIAAQSLAAGLAERDRAAALLAGALERERDARAALGEALAACERLAALAAGPHARPALRDAVGPLHASMLQLARNASPFAAGAPAAVSESPATIRVWPSVRAALEEVAARSPRIRLSGRVAGPALEGAEARVAGGAEGLRQIVCNLIANACEGDGVRGAGRVEVELREEAGGALGIRVADDGPGFSAARLAGTIAPFASSKPEGTGLGLYIAERLACASGGTLRRRNLDGGGAEVVVRLPRASLAAQGAGAPP